MKKHRIILVASVILVLVTIIIGITSGFALENHPYGEKNAVSYTDTINVDAVQTGNAKYLKTIMNDAGQKIDLYEDDAYEYYMVDSTHEITMIVMRTEEMVYLDDLFQKQDTPTISNEKANEILGMVISNVFPEYQSKDLAITLDKETGSHIEYYRYLIEEMDEDTRFNVASVSIAFNGQVTFISGSHNSRELFDVQSDINKSDLLGIVLSYLVNNKDQLEESGAQKGTPNEAEVLVATEDMVLPDGVNVGDTFTVEKLPEYSLYVSCIEDILSPNITKVIRKGTVVWEVSFVLRSSWGEYDSLFNPLVTVYVDVASGNVVDIVSTDGN